MLNPQHLRHPPPPSSRVSRFRSATAERRRVAINLLQSVDLTEMGKEGKLDPTIGRNEGKLIPSSNLMRLYYFQNFEKRFRVSFQLLCCWLLLPENGIMVFHEGGRDETCHLLSKNNYIFIEKKFAFHTVAFPMQFHPSNNVKSCHMSPTTSFLIILKNLFLFKCSSLVLLKLGKLPF